jgi:hypothetical protein
VKRELVGLTLIQETSKKKRYGGVRNLMADFTSEFRQWSECCAKHMKNAGSHIQ